jgi:hypothetical protein
LLSVTETKTPVKLLRITDTLTASLRVIFVIQCPYIVAPHLIFAGALGTGVY